MLLYFLIQLDEIIRGVLLTTVPTDLLQRALTLPVFFVAELVIQIIQTCGCKQRVQGKAVTQQRPTRS